MRFNSYLIRFAPARRASTAVGIALALSVVAATSAATLDLKVDDRPLDRAAKSASYAPVIKRVAPSVVNIYSTKILKAPQFYHDFFNDPFWRRFFGAPSAPGQRPQPERSQSLGSGVIVTEDGYILTNNHVVEGADKVEVALVDGKKKFTAKVVGTDPQTDVAVLKVDAQNLPACTLGDSDRLEVGDVALAIGNPFGVGQTVTMGIISGVGRTGFGVTRYEDWIQTDAAINPGNSGGALVDADGRLIGMNTFIVSGGSGGSAGVGFAIPINLARGVMEQIVGKGKVSRGYLGVRMQPEITPQLAKQFGLPDQNGVLVSQVEPGTAAAEAGVKPGDVIIEFNGKKVNDNAHLSLMVSQTPPKTRVQLKVLRDGREKTLSAMLAELPTDLAAGPDTLKENPEGSNDALDGVEVADLDSQSRRQYNVPDSVKGALITSVDSNCPAADAGLRVGDVIMEINRRPVESADAAVEASKKVKDESVLLRVWGRDGTRFVVVDNPKNK